LHVAYGNVKYENGSLRYATWNGHSWSVEMPEGETPLGTSNIRWSVSTVLDMSDTPHIAYTDPQGRLVKYSTRQNGKWRVEVVDSLSKEGYPDRNGIALDSSETPYISYYDAGSGVLKVAHRESSGWVKETVDTNFAGFTSSMQIDKGTIWLTYLDQTSHTLKFARRPLGNLQNRASNALSNRLDQKGDSSRAADQ
jgi:hypothetical protein